MPFKALHKWEINYFLSFFSNIHEFHKYLLTFKKYKVLTNFSYYPYFLGTTENF